MDDPVAPARPLAVKAAVGMLGLYWLVAMGMVAANLVRRGLPADGVAFFALWTPAVTAVLWTVWRGGPTATRCLGLLGRKFGPVVIVLPLTMFAVTRSDLAVTALRPGILAVPMAAGVSLTAAGLLLKRPEVAEWTAAARAGTGAFARAVLPGRVLAGLLGAGCVAFGLTETGGHPALRLAAGVLGGLLLAGCAALPALPPIRDRLAESAGDRT